MVFPVLEKFPFKQNYIHAFLPSVCNYSTIFLWLNIVTLNMNHDFYKLSLRFLVLFYQIQEPLIFFKFESLIMKQAAHLIVFKEYILQLVFIMETWEDLLETWIRNISLYFIFEIFPLLSGKWIISYPKKSKFFLIHVTDFLSSV